MKKNTIIEEFEKIQSALQQFEKGASVEEIKAALEITLELRTLQRRLSKLQANGIIVTSGKGRSLLYYLAKEPITLKDQKQESEKEPLPLSEKGKRIRHLVSQPIQKRKPVGYNLNFLKSYQPNVDSYLSAGERKILLEFGKTASLDQPAGTYAKEILQRLLIDLSWNSSRLEGNTYSLLDTQRLISQGHSADNKSAADAQMILNHKDAIEFIVQSSDEIGFNRYTITSLHALLSNNLLADPAASGRLRNFGVGITNSVYTPLSIPQQIEEFFEMMLTKAQQINDPFEKAFFIMVHLPYLQPFDDVNKRVSRLAMNIPLNNRNLAPLAFVDVPEEVYLQGILGVYELNQIELLKDVFIWAYERSALRYAALRQSLGEPDTFRMQYRDEIRKLISDIISGGLSRAEAIRRIEADSQVIPEKDRSKFIETIDTELLSLHEGNFARYFIRPSVFKSWKTAWDSE
ncbi:Fic family protein [Sediminibacterium ginsengisoli]|uniref:Fic/DOC family protein n=1 Tax=Sediminibacterium ginsengisoli TaxID=413434 RepID=A0A1T4JPZ6_9BACT|nr:Fic family protein [Sediminibacterium ginsengisoli]SJZ32181.1 Fic/DOC family protein [Sediminibacterium ginsengisoli]